MLTNQLLNKGAGVGVQDALCSVKSVWKMLEFCFHFLYFSWFTVRSHPLLCMGSLLCSGTSRALLPVDGAAGDWQRWAGSSRTQ